MPGELIYREEVIEAIHAKYDPNWEPALNAIEDAVNVIPSVDAVHVVRCQDCAFSEEIARNITCNQFYGAGHWDGYCAWWQRREDGET